MHPSREKLSLDLARAFACARYAQAHTGSLISNALILKQVLHGTNRTKT
jgi:hypothetical protein